MPTSMYAFTTALVLSLSLTPVVRRLASHLGMVDHPGTRKIHQTPIPLLGGLAIYLAAILSIILFLESESWSQIVAILGAATLLLGIGILDDRNMLHHQIKLMVAMPLMAVVQIISGVHFDILQGTLHGVLPGSMLLLADYVLTFVWIVGITAAFSILDHMDGLCAGVAAIASAFFLTFSFINGQTLVGTLAASMLGAALGFLWWNFKPARIFMGDGGAMFLGFMMAVLGIKLRFPDMPMTISWMLPVLLLAVPIFDTTLVTISRSRRGLMPFSSPGKDHTAHRLSNMHIGQLGAVLVMYGAGIVSGLLALLISWLTLWQAYIVGAVAVVVGLGLIVALEQAPYERQQKKRGS